MVILTESAWTFLLPGYWAWFVLLYLTWFLINMLIKYLSWSRFMQRERGRGSFCINGVLIWSWKVKAQSSATGNLKQLRLREDEFASHFDPNRLEKKYPTLGLFIYFELRQLNLSNHESNSRWTYVSNKPPLWASSFSLLETRRVYVF